MHNYICTLKIVMGTTHRDPHTVLMGIRGSWGGWFEEEKLGSSDFLLLFAGKVPILASGLEAITMGEKKSRETCQCSWRAWDV